MVNSRFTVAVHLLALLGFGRTRYPGMPLTSDFASKSVNTNPVVIRRILGSLRKAGMVSSQPGANGGWLLEHDPEQITLRDVYCAVEDEELFAMHHQPPSAGCMIGANIQEALEGFFREAEVAMLEKLGRRSVADVMAAVQLCAERRAG